MWWWKKLLISILVDFWWQICLFKWVHKAVFNEIGSRIGGQSQNINYLALLPLPRTNVEEYYISNSTASFVVCSRIVLVEWFRIVLLSVCLSVWWVPCVFWSWHSKYRTYHVKPPPPFFDKTLAFSFFFVNVWGWGRGVGEIYYFLGMCVWANRKLGISSFILIFRKNSKVKLLEIRRILRDFPSEAQST